MKINIKFKIETKTFVYLVIIATLIIIMFTQINWNKAIFEVIVYNESCSEPSSYWQDIQWEQLKLKQSSQSADEYELPDFSKCTQVTCECAKNTNTPCMAMCLECP